MLLHYPFYALLCGFPVYPECSLYHVHLMDFTLTAWLLSNKKTLMQLIKQEAEGTWWWRISYCEQFFYLSGEVKDSTQICNTTKYKTKVLVLEDHFISEYNKMNNAKKVWEGDSIDVLNYFSYFIAQKLINVIHVWHIRKQKYIPLIYSVNQQMHWKQNLLK